jgi:hypothetical protein
MLLGVYIWLLTRRRKFIFSSVVNLLLLQLGISVVYILTAVVATAVWLASEFEVWLDLVTVVLG